MTAPSTPPSKMNAMENACLLRDLLQDIAGEVDEAIGVAAELEIQTRTGPGQSKQQLAAEKMVDLLPTLDEVVCDLRCEMVVFERDMDCWERAPTSEPTTTIIPEPAVKRPPSPGKEDLGRVWCETSIVPIAQSPYALTDAVINAWLNDGPPPHVPSESDTESEEEEESEVEEAPPKRARICPARVDSHTEACTVCGGN